MSENSSTFKPMDVKTRTLVIGDIHGGLKALEQVIERVEVTPEDNLLFLGDYVDGWSESFEVIEYLLALEASHSCIFIKGNHDVWCHEWLQTGVADQVWLKHGGTGTIASYKNCSDVQKERHLDFFSRLKNYHTDSQHRLFIHAGFSSMHGPAHEHYKSNYNWDRTLWEVARTMDPSIPKSSPLYPERLKLYTEIYIGHTPTLAYNQSVPMHRMNVWNIDTGAGFYGKLSVLDARTKKFWQSDALPKLYSGENGRNKP